MKSTSWLRIAAGLTILQLIGHVLGAVLARPTHGPEEVALREAMRSYRFTIMGMERSYWDFYFGSGWIITAFLATIILVIWYTARVATDAPALARPLIATLALGYGAVTVVCALFFITAPIVNAAAVTACLAAAYFATGKARGDA